MLEAFKLKFSLDVVVTIHWRSCFELILWMNKLKTMDREAVCWKFLFKIQKVNPLKQLGKHYLDRGSAFTQVKSTEHMAKFNTKSISNWGTFCNFSLAPKRKIYKTSMKHLKIHKFPFKNVIVLAIECKMYLKNFTALVAFQNRPCAPSWRKQGWIPRRTISWWKASLPPQKESWAFFWTFSFHFLSFNGVFLTLKCRTLVLKHLHGDPAAAILLKMDVCH